MVIVASIVIVSVVGTDFLQRRDIFLMIRACVRRSRHGRRSGLDECFIVRRTIGAFWSTSIVFLSWKLLTVGSAWKKFYNGFQEGTRIIIVGHHSSFCSRLLSSSWIL
jgi:hypothetical protein